MINTCDKIYINRVKNFLALNTSCKETGGIITDLTEYALESTCIKNVGCMTKPGSDSTLQSGFGSPIQFVRKIKAEKFNSSLIKTILLISVFVAIYLWSLNIAASQNLTGIQIPSLLMTGIMITVFETGLKDSSPAE
mgnify:CR=1 FL=1